MLSRSRRWDLLHIRQAADSLCDGFSLRRRTSSVPEQVDGRDPAVPTRADAVRAPRQLRSPAAGGAAHSSSSRTRDERDDLPPCSKRARIDAAPPRRDTSRPPRSPRPAAPLVRRPRDRISDRDTFTTSYDLAADCSYGLPRRPLPTAIPFIAASQGLVISGPWPWPRPLVRPGIVALS